MPDVLYIQKDRLIQYETNLENSDEKPLILVPDLVIEVISPTDKYSDVSTKVDTYLADGVKLIWIVDPQRKTITVYEGNDTGKILRIEDRLTGGNVLPAFELDIKEIFS
ncbi:MAG: Uma2 family endonuclease [Phototrophicaceae bacterium]